MRENDALGLKISKKLAELYEGVVVAQTGARNQANNPSRRCILILLDRFDDLQTMLYHGWTYLTLIQDVFGIKNNTLEYAEDPNAPNKTTYSLDFDSD